MPSGTRTSLANLNKVSMPGSAPATELFHINIQSGYRGMGMGQKTYQRILECGECRRTPEDGEPMWEMCGMHICEACADSDDEPGETNEPR